MVGEWTATADDFSAPAGFSLRHCLLERRKRPIRALRLLLLPLKVRLQFRAGVLRLVLCRQVMPLRLCQAELFLGILKRAANPLEILFRGFLASEFLGEPID